jgi:SAM-dependent methyltransferase
MPAPAKRPTISGSALRWWSAIAARDGSISASIQLVKTLAEFLRDSTPERRRQRYGDIDFDWDYRVNTTSAAVGWRDRLLGVFNSPYQPTEPSLFHEMISIISSQPGFEFPNFTFIDLGSGKGRTLLMASDYPFRRVIGVELLPALHTIAQENLAKYHSDEQKCFSIESICADATEFAFPAEPTLLFLFNPLPESGLKRVIANLERSLQSSPRSVFVLYHNPLLAHVLDQSTTINRIIRTHQYALYASASNIATLAGITLVC